MPDFNRRQIVEIARFGFAPETCDYRNVEIMRAPTVHMTNRGQWTDPQSYLLSPPPKRVDCPVVGGGVDHVLIVLPDGVIKAIPR